MIHADNKKPPLFASRSTREHQRLHQNIIRLKNTIIEVIRKIFKKLHQIFTKVRETLERPKFHRVRKTKRHSPNRYARKTAPTKMKTASPELAVAPPLPRELPKALQSSSLFGDVDSETQKKVSLAVFTEIQGIPSKIQPGGDDLYFPKKKRLYPNPENPLEERFVCPWTFFVDHDPGTGHAVVTVNIPKIKIGSGTYKKVSTGMELDIPLSSGDDQPAVVKRKVAISRPENPHNFEAMVVYPLKTHAYLLEQLRSTEHPGKITDTPKIRTKVKRGTRKKELVQTYYPSTLQNVSEGISPIHQETVPFAQRLTLLEDVLQTVNSLSILGFIHRDVKTPNILLNENSVPYLNDFDLCTNFPLEVDGQYCYWDMAGQLGLVTHVTDLVGAMMSACVLLYGSEPPKGFYEDYEHTFLKKGSDVAFRIFALPKIREAVFAAKLKPLPMNTNNRKMVIDHLTDLFYNSTLNTEDHHNIKMILARTIADEKILSLFCDTLKKETLWRNILIASCFCHFAKIGEQKYRNLYRKKTLSSEFANFEKGITRWTLEVLMGLEKKIKFITDEPLNENNIPKVLKAIDKALKDKEKADTFDLGEKKLFLNLYDRYISLGHLLAKLKKNQDFFPETVDTQLFPALISSNPESRIEAIEKGFEFFGTAGELRKKIQEIRIEYENEIILKGVEITDDLYSR